METSRHWETKLRSPKTGKVSDRWAPGEEEYYLDLATEIGDRATNIATGVRRLVPRTSVALPRPPKEIGDLVKAQNPDVEVLYPWESGVKANDNTYPFQVRKK